MSNRQIAGWSAVVFVVLTVVSTFIAGEPPPAVSDPAEEIAEFYADNQDALLFGNILNTLAGVFFVLFFAGLYLRLRPADRAEDEPWAFVGLLGAIFTGVAAIAGQAAASVSILRGDEETGVSAAFHDLTTMGYTLTGLGIAVAVFGFGFAMAHANLGPSWLLYYSDAVAVLGLVGASSAGSSSEVWGLIGLLAFLAFAAWAVVVGLWLAREGVTPTAATGPPAGP